MIKLYKKSELYFTLVLIAVYCLSMSLADNFSATLGVNHLFSLPVIIVISVFLSCFMKKNGLSYKYGICKAEVSPLKMLVYIPLIILPVVNLWHGFSSETSLIETLLYIFTMFGVGYTEEVIFRGFLYNAILNDSKKTAIVVSSLTFGTGHIINLFNGSGMNLTDNILQIISAISVGFLFVIIYDKTKSLFPCIITHGIFNSLSIFSDTVKLSITEQIFDCVFIILLSVTYSFYIIKTDMKTSCKD